MAKLTLTDLNSLENQQSAISTVNTNNQAIEDALENTLSLDGTSPNAMGADLDMNSNQIINLPAASSATEPVRFSEFQGAISGALGLSTTGIVVAKSPTEIVTTEILGTTGEVTVTSGDGTLGSPIVSLPNTLVFTGKTITGGTFEDITVTPPTTFTAIDSQFKIQDDVDDTKTLAFELTNISTGEDRVLSVPDASTTLVGTDTTQTLTNKTLTTPVISTISNTGTLTLPTSTDTLVGRDTTDTLTNKTLTSPTISTIVNTGTLTLPTSTDTLVGRATTDTLTNKTLTAPTVNTPDINGGTVDNITSLGVRSSGSGAFDLKIANTENLTANKTLTVKTNDADRTVDLGGNITTGGALTTSGANSVTLTTTGATNVTLPTSGTLVNSSVTSLPSLATVGTITSGVWNGTAIPVANGGTGATSASGARTNLGTVIGTDVQAYNAKLADIAGLTLSQGDVLYYNGTNLTNLGPGTSGNFLKTQGAGANPVWASVPGGGDVLSTNNGSDFADVTTTLANLGALFTPQGRLTLVSGSPVMSSSQSAKTTVYYTPYNGNIIPIYDGSKFLPKAFSELSQLTTDTSKSPGSVGTSTNYDVFVWNDSGTLRATRGPGWTSATSRGTGAGTSELTSINGIYLNANSITNGPAASRGTYVGTIHSNGSSSIDFIYGASATAGAINVWNMYNRLTISTTAYDSTSTWTYSSSTPRQANNSGVNQVSFVTGLAQDSIEGSYTDSFNLAQNTTASGAIGMALDSASTFDRYVNPQRASTSGTVTIAGCVTNSWLPQIGFHYISANEAGDGTNSVTFIGSARQGLTVKLRA